MHYKHVHLDIVVFFSYTLFWALKKNYLSMYSAGFLSLSECLKLPNSFKRQNIVFVSNNIWHMQ